MLEDGLRREHDEGGCEEREWPSSGRCHYAAVPAKHEIDEWTALRDAGRRPTATACEGSGSDGDADSLGELHHRRRRLA